MNPGEQQSPETTKIPVNFAEAEVSEQKPEQPVPAPEPAPGQPEEPLAPEPPAESVAEMPSLSEQPAEEPAQPAAEHQEQAPVEPQPSAEVQVQPEVPATQPADQPLKPGRSKKTLLTAGSVIIIIAVIAVVAVLMDGHKKPRPVNTQAATASPVKYTDPQTGFTILRPTGWNSVPPVASSGDAAEFQDPTADTINASAAYRPSITISYAPSHGQTVAQVVNNIDSSLAKQTPGYKNLGTTQETIGGIPGTLLTYSYTLSGDSVTFPVTAEELVVIKDGRGYILHGVSLSSAWTQHKQVIENSLLSFQP